MKTIALLSRESAILSFFLVSLEIIYYNIINMIVGVFNEAK